MAAALTTACALVAGLTVAASADDDTPVPTRSEVREARSAAAAGQRDVAAVRADLAGARAETERAQVRAAKAAEAYNGARYAAELASDEAETARAAEAEATATMKRLGVAYRRAALNSYTTGSELAVANSLLEADGLGQLMDRLGSAQVGQQTLGGRRDDFAAAQAAAATARERADAAKADADTKAEAAQKAQDEARTSADAAATAEQATAAREQQLVAELARLQGISVDLAESREQGLARKAAEAAARREAAAERERVARAEREQAAREQTRRDAAAREARERRAQAAAQSRPDAPAPAPAPTPTPAPDPAPPSPSGGAAAAVAFARAQLGEPYVWAAAGPGSWDCSGLTMGAWNAGGKSLPHYSVAQYEQSTPIGAGELQPGDLVFWSDGGPSEIFHVALYAGNGMIIHAPRTGKPVTEESMHYWIEPSFYARP